MPSLLPGAARASSRHHERAPVFYFWSYFLFPYFPLTVGSDGKSSPSLGTAAFLTPHGRSHNPALTCRRQRLLVPLTDEEARPRRCRHVPGWHSQEAEDPAHVPLSRVCSPSRPLLLPRQFTQQGAPAHCLSGEG